MNQSKSYIGIANKQLSFGRISKLHFIISLNLIIAFILVVLFGIENGLAQTASITSNTESTSSQTCEKLSHCSDNEIKEGNVCILEPHMFNFQNPNTDSIGTSGYISDLNQTYSCPPDSLVYFTRDINKIMEGLDDVAERCVKIKRLYFSGHGFPGHLANGLNKSNINQLRDYSCLMADNPIVDLTGCNTGRKCAGKFFMQKTAEALFHNTKGTVIAPNVNFYMAEGVGFDKMGIFRNRGESYTESPFGYNSLTYRPPPPRPPQTTWEQLDNRTNYQDTIMAGLAESRSDEHTSLKEACVDTIESLIEDIRKIEDHYKKEKICQPLLECADPPYNAILSRAEKAAGVLERSRPSNSAIQLELSTNFHYALKEIHERLLSCDYQCDRYRSRYRNRYRGGTRIRNRNRNGNGNRNRCAHESYSCVSYNDEGRCVQKYTAGCSLGDYFLPQNTSFFSKGRPLRQLDQQGVE